MSEAKRLLEQATPLPWDQLMNKVVRRLEGIAACESDERDDREELANAALIVYAVNRLPDYEAAVEALERIARIGWERTNRPNDDLFALAQIAEDALARLREGEAAHV